ncbi:MAG: GMC family oxidoreductase [Deltaproteobacteria bacterium]|nr:GMC family oxidoreductase [Deltaproteobacteria bacterium]
MVSSNDLPIISGTQLRKDTEDEADVVVIGSGCGGASLACRLAEQGKKVIVVEQGGYHGSRDFDQRELHMLAKIDGGRGLDTAHDGAAAFTYGNNIGGASVHYWADSFRTPADRLQLWEQKFGISGHGVDVVTPHFEQLERDLNVHLAADDYVNVMNAKVRDAARALGWHVAKVPQARRGCVRSGHCMQGCSFDAKQSQLVTYIPRALIAGARIYSDVRALTLTSSSPGLAGTCTSLVCGVVDRASGALTGRTLTIKAKAYVVAAGGFATPELLLRQSGLQERLPHLGEHFFCNPCAQTHAFFADDITQWRNIPAAWGVEHFRLATENGGQYVEGGYLLMANQLHPGTLAACLLVDGDRQREIFSRYKQLGGTIAWIDDVEEGRVFLEGGRRKIEVPLTGGNGSRLRDAWTKQATLLFQAGATEVFFGDVDDTRLQSASQIEAAVARLSLAPGKNLLAAPHPGGAARMGRDPKSSVVDVDHRIHGSDNVYVADPSVFPSAPSVDPSLSIMAFSFVCADLIASRH